MILKCEIEHCIKAIYKLQNSWHFENKRYCLTALKITYLKKNYSQSINDNCISLIRIAAGAPSSIVLKFQQKCSKWSENVLFLLLLLLDSLWRSEYEKVTWNIILWLKNSFEKRIEWCLRVSHFIDFSTFISKKSRNIKTDVILLSRYIILMESL